MAEDEKGFKVKDRRRFTADGELRDDAAEDPPEAAEPAPRLEPSRAERSRAEPSPAESSRTEPPPPEVAGRSGRPPMDFLTFVASLATNALAALGMLPEEQAKGLPVNPELGREYIEILAMLADKTRGNLTPDEERGLQRILADLRMAYVEVSRRAGSP